MSERSRSLVHKRNSLIMCIVYFAIVVLLSPPVFSLTTSTDCLVTVNNKTYDLSLLRKWNPWSITVTRNGSLVSYEISLCDGLNSTGENDPCAGGSVCKVSNGQRQLIAGTTKRLDSRSLKLDIETLFIHLKGPACTNPGSSGNQSAILILTCGQHLGYPSVYTESSCKTSFSWSTSVVCPVVSNPFQEVPCATYDKVGRFYDLTPLINNVANHKVETHDGSDFMSINVCSYLNNENDTVNCPKNISSCIKRKGNFLPAGSLKGPLKLKTNDTGLELVYESAFKIGNCGGPTKTVIDFRCPSQGKGKDPELVLSADCLYSVYWETEYACPVAVLLGNVTSCKFSPEIHGVDIDLSPLRKPAGEIPYNVSGIIDGKSVDFYFNLCGGIGQTFKCEDQNWRSSTVCVKESQNQTDPGIIYGNSQKILKYVAGEVTLEYAGNVKCGENGELWKTVIKFVCDKNSDNGGVGKAKFLGQDSCINWFEWPTKFVCAKNRKFDCKLQSGPLSLVLNPIYRHHSQATWKAIDSLSPPGKSREIYLNLCDGHDLMGAAQPCQSSSSICMIDNNTSVSLGEKTDNPNIKYEYIDGTHTYQVEFVHGSACPGGFKKSTLILECAKTSYTSSPVLVKETPCEYEFKWQTYAVCQHQRLNFNDCKFEDKDKGITVDLNQLKSSTFYEIKTEDYYYYINVCGPVKNTPCNHLGMDEARGCQVKKKEMQKAWSLGEIPIGAAYDDGELINITYTGGTPYRDSKQTLRSMSVTFICDMGAGKGKPIFNGEDNKIYSFLWRTSLVCAAEDSATVCSVYDETLKKQYDLSRLTKLTDDFEILSPDKKKKFYLNVCRPLNKAKNCDKNSAACSIEMKDGKETTKATNLGKALQGPKLYGAGHLELDYILGDDCISYGEKKNYHVIINFICNTKTLESQGPKFLGILANCTYNFLWATEAACPIGKEEFHECNYVDPVTGVTFDLNPLNKRDSFYEIKSGKRKFQINICGPVGGNGCSSPDFHEDVSACMLNEEGKTELVLGYTESGILNVFEGLPTELYYLGLKNLTHSSTTVFEFECNHSAKEPIITFTKEDNNNFHFLVSTLLVCQPESLKCHIISDEGLEYDFSTLRRKSYWSVKDQNDKKLYHLSFCGAITGVGGLTCHGAGICSTEEVDDLEGESLGRQINSPIALDDGSILIRYEDGSPCENKFFNNSAVVNLLCSSVEKPPKLIRKSQECEYFFTMYTPTACPIETFKGSNCQVKDNIYNNLYDLSPLINKTNNYISMGNGHTYLINVCEGLSDPPTGCEDSAICQTKETDPKFAVNAGQASSELIYNDGLIQLIYRGGKSNCHKQYNRSAIINFICDHSTEGLAGPNFLQEDHDCTYVFEWPTSWACPPFREQSCDVEDSEGNYYDLSPLSLPNNNYIIENPLNPNQKFIINVCRTIVHKPGSRCPYDSASCLELSDEISILGKYKNLGSLTPTYNPVFENDVLKIRYNNGDHCRKEGTLNRLMETVIEFQCDETAFGSQPEFLAFENCQYTFIWYTPYACVKTTTPHIFGNCSFTNPESGYVYDFSSLRDKEVSVQSSPNHKFVLSICHQLKDSSCGKGTGSCQMEHAGEQRSFNSGIANSDIYSKDGNMFLVYSNGSLCHNKQFRRSTVIQFICDKDRSYGESKVSFVKESSDCTYNFNWHTKLACDQTQLNPNPKPKTNKELCKVQTQKGLVDLSSVMSQLYMAPSSLSSNAMYFIIVCDQIINNFLQIPKGSAAGCINCSPNGNLNLGKFHDPPFVNEDNVVELKYSNGSTCLSDPTKQMSSSIYFICTSEETDSPLDVVGSSDDDCTVYFEFSSPYFCPFKPMSCGYGHESKGFHVELSEFEKQNEAFEVVNGKDKYYISVCKPITLNNCTGAGVCLVNERGNQDFGLVKNSFVYHNSIHMTLTYDSDVNCSDSATGKRHTEIQFYCDRSAGLGKPQLYKKYSCRLIFLWPTAEVCSTPQPVCTLWTKDKKLYDLRVLSSISHSWKVSDEMGNTFWLNMCREVHRDTVGHTNSSCPPYSSVCMVPSNSTTGISIGSVLTQKIRIDSVTKDIVLTYDHGDENICSKIKDKSDKKAKTEIRLQCGQHTGLPKLISNSNCEFKFEWKTQIACPTLENEPMYEKNGIIYDMRLQTFGIIINISSLMTDTYQVVEPNRKDYVYYINLANGVGDTISDPICQNSSVCQTKPNGTFFRDIGSIGTKMFFLKGREMKLVLTSHGRKCGKNNSKNVTTIINFQCSRMHGKSAPKFKYESGDCDYIFEWETDAVCAHHEIYNDPDKLFEKASNNQPSDVAKALSVSAILAIVCAILAAFLVFGVLVKKERRYAIRNKARQCFQRVRLPRYRYMQCYFLRLRNENSHHSRTEGEAVLLTPDDPLPKFQDDSDVDPIA